MGYHHDDIGDETAQEKRVLEYGKILEKWVHNFYFVSFLSYLSVIVFSCLHLLYTEHVVSFVEKIQDSENTDIHKMKRIARCTGNISKVVDSSIQICTYQ